MARYLKRYLPATLLGIHLLLKIIFPDPSLLLDLILFNAVVLALLFTVYANSQFTDPTGRAMLSFALFFWFLGSLLSTFSELFPDHSISSMYSNLCYVLMYPFAFIGLSRAIRVGRKFNPLEILDAAILGIGLSAAGSAFFIEPIVPHFGGDPVKTFFAVLFPIADLVLVALVLTFSLLAPFSTRNAFICAGISIFALSDFIFLGLTLRRIYTLGSVSDDLWLIGLVVIIEGLHYNSGSRERRENNSLHPIFIVLTVMMCATLLGVASLRPNYLPNFVILPTVATLLLAFARMTIALNQANSLHEERSLARTDELTGLPNRRRFLTELEAMAKNAHAPCAVLLLDLDGFKPVNDLYGHDIGDRLLKEVSKRFSRVLPPDSILARLGGDEFAAIVRGEYETTVEVALALRATLSYPFSIAEREISVGVSVGHVANDGSPDLMRRADLAMYQAKREGVGVWAEPF